MYNNDYMYAIERSDEYLAHYGIRGMKWGVRKAIASGNSARLSKQYAKASKKLAKLEKRAANSKKYARRAALMGAGAAAAGGLAAAGTGGVGNFMRANSALAGHAQKAAGKVVRTAGHVGSRLGIKGASRLSSAGLKMQRSSDAASKAMYLAGRDVTRWGQKHTVSNALATKYGSVAGKVTAPAAGGAYAQKMASDAARRKAKGAISGVSNNTIARIGAGAIGAGLAVGAAKNAYRAATAKKKAEKFRSAMNESFKGTKYANGGKPRQGKKRRR